MDDASQAIPAYVRMQLATALAPLVQRIEELERTVRALQAKQPSPSLFDRWIRNDAFSRPAGDASRATSTSAKPSSARAEANAP